MNFQNVSNRAIWGGGEYLQLRLGGITPLGENILAQKGADLPPLPFWKSLSPSQIQPSLTQAKELKSWVTYVFGYVFAVPLAIFEIFAYLQYLW